MTESEVIAAEKGESEDYDDDDDYVQQDSDEELQEAFAAGLLKPGLNTVLEQKKKRKSINNIAGLKQKLDVFKLDLPWIETLDLVNKPAPLAPELAYREDQHLKEREKLLKASKSTMSLSSDPVHNDFLREMLFYRQAQAAVLVALPRLKASNVPTKRPEDYFAQMAKTDQHMQKIREKLVTKQATEERMEKIRKLRELRKFGKQVQVEAQQKKQKEKKEMLDQVKKFRKGQTDTIDFLDDMDDDAGRRGKKSDQGRQGRPGQGKSSLHRREFKDSKFGFGGKKKGSKRNTADSVNDTSSYRPFKKGGKGPPGGVKGRGKGNLGQQLKSKRLGKSRRKQMRNKKK